MIEECQECGAALDDSCHDTNTNGIPTGSWCPSCCPECRENPTPNRADDYRRALVDLRDAVDTIAAAAWTVGTPFAKEIADDLWAASRGAWDRMNRDGYPADRDGLVAWLEANGWVRGIGGSGGAIWLHPVDGELAVPHGLNRDSYEWLGVLHRAGFPVPCNCCDGSGVRPPFGSEWAPRR